MTGASFGRLQGVGGRLCTLLLSLVVTLLFLALLMSGLPGTTALFVGDYPIDNNIAAGRIFRAERTTTAFAVSDQSSGTAADQSSVTAFANDGRYFLTRSWPAAFDSARYLDLEPNAPLPVGLSVSNGSLNLRVASDAGTGSLCLYLELRQASSNALLATHGSSVSPLVCTGGISWSLLSVPLAGVTTTDVANDLRVRIFASDSATGALRVDQATVTGDTPYVTFTLYPILTRELYDGQTELLRWGLAGP